MNANSIVSGRDHHALATNTHAFTLAQTAMLESLSPQTVSGGDGDGSE